LVHLGNIVEIEKGEIVKDAQGIPSIILKDSGTHLPVSVSNHGRFERIVAIQILST
jgi:hypothetical protein